MPANVGIIAYKTTRKKRSRIFLHSGKHVRVRVHRDRNAAVT